MPKPKYLTEYPANRDFEGHVGGVRGAAPQRVFFYFFDFFC